MLIIEPKHYTKQGGVKQRVLKELKQKEHLHLWNEEDFSVRLKAYKAQARKNGTGIHQGWAAIEIAQDVINDCYSTK